MERTLNISDQDLHTTLNEFLEEKEKKPKESIWNFSTITGLVLVLISAAFVGNVVSTQLLGIATLPFLSTLMSVTPYIGGAILGLLLIGMFSRNKSEKIEAKEEKEKVRETYDKLDKFLYSEEETKTYRQKTKTKTSSASKFERFKVSTSNRLMKSRTDKKIAGVCGGLAKHLGISATIIRLLFVAAIILGWGSFILVYIALAFVMPKEPIYEMDDFKSF
ncbi:PspC domain-containing protein [Rhodohalobacter sp. 614A]|uniref:PspC domain-containing protein n=1 Tax=Rhodohalobacter sp. 614A TaxID=2908649 RepID=UPI001F42DD8D|nr:PspC domain-containing protein [Rhodohalobacter sp. 614A]